MNKKRIIKWSVGLSAIALLLFGVLVVHIAIVTNPKGKPHYGIQLSRIDFNKKLDTAQANDICAYIKSIKGVGNTMISYEHNNIVFAHHLDVVSGQEVFDQVQNEKHIDAKRFLLTPEEIAKTAKCPVMKEKGLLTSLAHTIQVHFL